jgi:hypothetical protein
MNARSLSIFFVATSGKNQIFLGVRAVCCRAKILSANEFEGSFCIQCQAIKAFNGESGSENSFANE